MSARSPSRRKCQYRRPPSGLISKSPLKYSDESIGSRFSIRSTSTASAAWSTIKSLKKRSFSGVRNQPSASFAEAVVPQDTLNDCASVTDNAAMVPLLGATASSPPRKMRSPFKNPSFKSSSFLKSTDGSFKIGKMSDGSQASAAVRRKRWKPSTKMSSRIHLASNSRRYDSFASSRGTPSPPPAHAEIMSSAPQNFMEYTFDFDFIPESNYFKSVDSGDVFMRSSTTSSETPPPPPPPPIEPFFVNGFHPIPTLEECYVNDGFEMKIDEATDEASESEEHNLSDIEHVMTASAGIKYFESLSPTSLTLPSSSSLKSIIFEVQRNDDDLDVESPSSIPSINDEDIYLPSIDSNEGVNQLSSERESADTKNISDSVIAQTLTGEVVAYPAPQSVIHAEKKRNSANLWMEVADASDMSNDIPDIANDGEESISSTSNVGGILSSLSEEYGDVSEAIVKAQSSKDAANNTLAWSALAILLGSPAPSCVQKMKNKTEAKNLWADDITDEDDELLSLAASEINEPADDYSLPILDPNDYFTDELSLDELQIDSDATSPLTNQKDATDSAIMWTALSALLASPAPSCVRNKKEKCKPKNLWAADDAGQGEDIISLNEFKMTSDDLAHDQSPDEVSLADIDLSLSALRLDSEESYQLNRPDVGSSQKTEDIANSTLAWGALTALLGLPAPSSVIKKNIRPNKNLWADDGNDTDLFSLATSEANDCASIPSLAADSQFDSAPPSPLIYSASSLYVQSPERDNTAIQTYIEWRN